MEGEFRRRDNRIIRAGEVAQFAYCAHAWWLGNVEGLPSTHRREMAAGTAAHRRHGIGVRLALWAGRLAYALLVLAALLGAFWWLGR